MVQLRAKAVVGSAASWPIIDRSSSASPRKRRNGSLSPPQSVQVDPRDATIQRDASRNLLKISADPQRQPSNGLPPWQRSTRCLPQLSPSQRIEGNFNPRFCITEAIGVPQVNGVQSFSEENVETLASQAPVACRPRKTSRQS